MRLRSGRARFRRCLLASGLTLSGLACDGSRGPSDRPLPDDGEHPAPRLAVVDDRGIEIGVIPSPRIISLIPSLTEVLLALEVDDLLVARTRYDTDPRTAHLPSVGGGIDPSLEAVIALSPDLIIGWEDRGARATLSRLEAMGVSVYGAQTQDLADVARHAEALGILTGVAEAGAALARGLEGEMAAVAGSVRDRSRPTVLYVVWPDPPQTAGSGTYIDEILRTAGGVNSFADAPGLWPLISMEQIVRRDPDFVIIPAGGGGAPIDTTWLRRDPGWRSLGAVAAGRVMVVEADLFSRPGPAIPEAARILRDFLHPGAGR